MSNLCPYCGKCAHCEHPSWECPKLPNERGLVGKIHKILKENYSHQCEAYLQASFELGELIKSLLHSHTQRTIEILEGMKVEVVDLTKAKNQGLIQARFSAEEYNKALSDAIARLKEEDEEVESKIRYKYFFREKEDRRKTF